MLLSSILDYLPIHRLVGLVYRGLLSVGFLSCHNYLYYAFVTRESRVVACDEGTRLSAPSPA